MDSQPISIIEPTGCFVPIKSLPFIQKNEITKNHYVVPSFAMAGESQAEVMSLLFNQKDPAAFKPKEEYERTVPWHIDGNSSLVTLFQHTSLGQENPVTRNCLVGLGQRLGITSIIIIVSIETIGTVYPLLDNLVNSMALETNPSNSQTEQPSWWSRVILIINQQHTVNDQATINQRRSILTEEIPRIQARYKLSNPLSILFLSTTLYCQLKDYTVQQVRYKSCCQRILWQMMEKHMLSGRWSSEFISLQTRTTNTTTTSLINVLNEDDESSSSSDDAIFKTVIDFENGKRKKMTKKATRRQVQKLHSHDGDNGTSLPTTIIRSRYL
ncbi:hypothetical protein BD770DRAFT_334006 [Pilaira anomala]|nr:hypothetical protein BD770DRAFT_334006 [Pilaira anomala]